MILSGTVIGLVCVAALLAASLFIVYLDKREKGRGAAAKSKFLSRLALVLFLMAFVSAVGVTLVSGISPREERGAAIGQVSEGEMNRLKEKIAADSRDVASRERLGHLYLQQQDFENVFLMAHEALQVNPKSVESRTHMGMVFFAMQDLQKAIKQFDEALVLDPNNTEALLFKGIVQFQGLQDLKGAKKTWEKFLQVAKPGDTGIERVKMFLESVNAALMHN